MRQPPFKLAINTKFATDTPAALLTIPPAEEVHGGEQRAPDIGLVIVGVCFAEAGDGAWVGPLIQEAAVVPGVVIPAVGGAGVPLAHLAQQPLHGVVAARFADEQLAAPQLLGGPNGVVPEVVDDLQFTYPTGATEVIRPVPPTRARTGSPRNGVNPVK